MLKQSNLNTNNAIAQKLAKLTAEYNAIDLSRNYTEFACSKALIDSLNKHIADHSKYAPVEGCTELRKTISNLLNKKYFRSVDPETEITITAGATQALFCAIASSVGEGDEAIIFEPSYRTYIDAINLSGARATYLQLKDDMTIDWNEVQKVITSNTKLIIINSPQYPTGAVLTSDDWESLQKLIIGTKIRVISDESLGEVTYSDSESSSLSFYPRLANCSFIIGSLSKSLCVAGWKIGYCIAPADITQNFRKVQGIIANSINYPMQMAFADYLNNHNEDTIFPYASQLEANKLMLQKELNGSRLKVFPIKGGYYQVIDYSECSNLSDTELAEMLIKEFGVSVMPMSLFFHDKHNRMQIRLNIAVDSQKLRSAIEQLKKFANQ